MKRASAFTMLELMIAMTLASVVILGMMQLYQGVVRYLDYARNSLSLNRQASLLLNQMERDLSTAYIPTLAKQVQEKDVTHEEKGTGDRATDQEGEVSTQVSLTPAQKEKEAKEVREQRRKFFVGTIDDRSDAVKIDGKRRELVKTVSFISTNLLQVYGDKRAHLVRVIYEMIVDKERSFRDIVSYQLIRKETNDLNNVEGKIDEFAPHRGPRVQQYVVARDIKSLVVEYITRSKLKKDGGQGKEPIREIKSLRWGHDNDDMAGVVPEKIDVWLEFWDPKHIKGIRFSSRIHVFSYPTPEEDEKSKTRTHGESLNESLQNKESAVAGLGKKSLAESGVVTQPSQR